MKGSTSSGFVGTLTVPAVGLVLMMAVWSARVAAHPSGAPKVACATMVPTGHVGANGEQDAPSPYQIVPSKTQLSSSEDVTVTLSVKSSDADKTFRGYMLMAFDSANDTAGIGTFTIDSGVGKTMDCSFGTKVAVTHISKADKTSVAAVWTPPSGYSGNVIFRASFVQTLPVYWVRQSSSPVKVSS